MNPLTQVKNTQKITAREHAIGISEEGSWHAKYKNSAYVYVGGLPFDLTEGDVLAVFAQYGEIVDVNLVRDKATGKSKGFAFLAYEDQRSTVLAVDNLNGARVVGRIIKVDHVGDYKRKLEEDEEEKERKREERGVCYAFQRGECNRGDACKFSHDEQRNANTGWGGEAGAGWKHDKFDGSMKDASRRISMVSTKGVGNGNSEREANPRGSFPPSKREAPVDARVENRRMPSPEKKGRDNDRLMQPPEDRRGNDDGRRGRGDDRPNRRDPDRRDGRDDYRPDGRDPDRRDGRDDDRRGRTDEGRDHRDSDRRERENVRRGDRKSDRMEEEEEDGRDRSSSRRERDDDRRDRSSDRRDRNSDCRDREEDRRDRRDDSREPRNVKPRR